MNSQHKKTKQTNKQKTPVIWELKNTKREEENMEPIEANEEKNSIGEDPNPLSSVSWKSDSVGPSHHGQSFKGQALLQSAESPPQDKSMTASPAMSVDARPSSLKTLHLDWPFLG